MINALDNWVCANLSGEDLTWVVNATEDMVDVADQLSLEEACKLAISSLPKTIGERPAICFSGGIDSQTVIDTFLIAGVTPNVVVFKFIDDFNEPDVSLAIKFCESRNIVPHIIEFDVIRFLNNRLLEFATKYKISSPQFAVHLYLSGELQKLGYTSAIFGGNNLFRLQDGSWYIPEKEELDWCYYSEQINFPILGNFWLQDWRLSLKATLFMEGFTPKDKIVNYQAKVNGYRKMGYDIIPQDQKYNGFESVKKYYEEMTGDGWAFELQFRIPLKKASGVARNKYITIPQETETRINILKQQKYKEI